MDKREALAVLEEIHSFCPKDWVINCITMDRPSSQISKADAEEYQITMECELDKHSRRCLEPIIEKYKLTMQEEKGGIKLQSK
jgi:hypothetical protein